MSFSNSQSPSPAGPAFPQRPVPGRSGRAIQVRANFFPVQSLPQRPIHHYEVAIDPEVPPAKSRRVYQLWEDEALLSGSLGGVRPVFDGRKNVYASRALPIIEGDFSEFTVDFYDNDDPLSVRGTPKRFKLSLIKVGEIDMQRLGHFLEGRLLETPLEAINALDILLRHRPSLIYTTVGRCFYTPDSAASIANGAQLWQGFHQSVRPTRGSLLINLDVSATAFFQAGPLIEMVAKILNRNTPNDLRAPITEKDRIKLDKTLRGLKIAVTHRGSIRRKYRIARVTNTAVARTTFTQEAIGREETVAGYFMSKYNVTLYFPHLPCLVVGDPAKLVYLPLEVCDVVPGQRHLRKLNERQTAEMIKFTCQPPHVRSNKISAGITILQQRDNEYLKEFDVSIGHEMAIVNSRILPAPAISYHPASKEPVITPREGAWNLRDKMVAQGVTIRSWSVVAFGTDHDYPVLAIQKFVTLLVQTCEECGVFVQNKQPPISYANPHGNVEKTIIDAYMVAGNSFQERPQLVVCILPNTGVPLYAEIKRVSDTVVGLATQCIQAKHMFAAKRQYCANVCLKINVKLGGMNSYLSNGQLPFVSERPTIVFGADVTQQHPAPGSASTQSIAALVGSMDAQCSRYAASIRVQKGRQEMIQDLASMVVELLKTFYQTCGAKPERICFFRDGLSEGQFHDVLKAEIEAMRAACAMLEATYFPTITYIVVQKRHHARFFPIRKEDSDKSGNVLPGTVIDTGVTHPSEFDFYLCSHPGLQGTSKPTHYHVLYDENRFTSDSLQELTYRLCYLYCRATRSVSVVPPAYYAHLVAARARFHATGDGWMEGFSDAASVMSQMSSVSVGGVGGMVGAPAGVNALSMQMGSLSMSQLSGEGPASASGSGAAPTMMGKRASMANLAAGPVRTLNSRSSGYFVGAGGGPAGGAVGFVKTGFPSANAGAGSFGGDSSAENSGSGGAMRVMNYGVVKSELASVMWYM
ncbi:eukaryotic translation initiation factor 2C, 2 [Entophlyctis luteolus]|nr:eukaryotic translation initiation factor 2C, 2 [Entophlyctis luteolus]